MSFDLEYYNKRQFRISLQLTFYCPHGCWYCNQGKPYESSKDTIVETLGEKEYIRKILNLTGGTSSRFLMFGGEPLAHPSVVPISQAILEAGHTVVYQTNATMIDKLAPLKPWKEQIEFQASFHMGTYSKERIKHYMTEIIPKMQATGRSTRLILVCVPAILNNLAELLRLIPDVQFEFVEFYGTVNNQQYPSAYTKDEKDTIDALRNEFKHNYASSEDLSRLNNTLFCKGVKCVEQTKLLRVNPYGQVTACATPIGNLADLELSYKDAPPQGCKSDVCGCVAMGYDSCLKPNGISLSQYWELMKDAYTAKVLP